MTTVSATVARAGLAGLLLAALPGLLGSIVAADDWQDGRGSFYGNAGSGWSIHRGSCGYGYIRADRGTGWDVTAPSDKFPGFAGSCGTCYEVRCRDAVIHDGYGAEINRTSACRDPEASVVVTVTDSCPCYYPSNAYSNKRWCCGDMPHFDLSAWAFEKLADPKNGVIPLQYRKVDCSYVPSKPAPKPAHSMPGEPYDAYHDAPKPCENPQCSNQPKPGDRVEAFARGSGEEGVPKEWSQKGGDGAGSGGAWQPSVKSGTQWSEGGQTCADLQPHSAGTLTFQAPSADTIASGSKLHFCAKYETANAKPSVGIAGAKAATGLVKVDGLKGAGQQDGTCYDVDMDGQLASLQGSPKVSDKAYDRIVFQCQGDQDCKFCVGGISIAK